MSEYQYIEFRAVGRPLTDKEAAFAEQQSSRAEVSRRCFSNQYNSGSLRGDVRHEDDYRFGQRFNVRTTKRQVELK